jgi:hypothetical protein
MKDYEKKIVSELLDMASSLYNNRGCNDTPKKIIDIMSAEERVELSRNMAIENGDLREWENGESNLECFDFCLMSYFSSRILDKAEPEKIIVNWEPGYKMLESQEIVIDTVTFIYDGKQLETKTSHHGIAEGHLIRSISAWLNIPVDLIVINEPEILNRHYGCDEGEGL